MEITLGLQTEKTSSIYGSGQMGNLTLYARTRLTNDSG